MSRSVGKQQVLGAFHISLSPPPGIALINSSLVSPSSEMRAVNTGEKGFQRVRLFLNPVPSKIKFKAITFKFT